MYTSLFYKLKAHQEHNRILDMFFKSWVDSTCANQVEYINLDHVIQVDCKRQEDAVALRLKGIPLEFAGYFDTIN